MTVATALAVSWKTVDELETERNQQGNKQHNERQVDGDPRGGRIDIGKML
jgi:hypothetical protein